MIIFCEDCGEKNQVTAGQLKTGRAIFTCRVCGYANCFAFDSGPTARQTDQDLKQILDKQIKKSQTLLGCFICDRRYEILINRMPASLPQKDVLILGRCVCQGHQHAAVAIDDLSETWIQISDKAILVFKNSHNLFLVLVGQGPVFGENLISDETRYAFQCFTPQS